MMIFERVKRSGQRFKKTLSQSHNKFYQKIMHHRRIQLQEEGTGFENIVDDTQLYTKAQAREQIYKIKRFSNYLEDDLDTGLDVVKKQQFRKKKSLIDQYENALQQNDFLNNNISSPEKYSPSKLLKETKDSAIKGGESDLNSKQQQPQLNSDYNERFINRTGQDADAQRTDMELQALFKQSRETFIEQMKQREAQRITRPEVLQLFEKHALENISFVQYVKFMKDAEILDQVVNKLMDTMPSFTQTNILDLKQLLPEADKKLFIAFRDHELTLDQLKTRVNKKMQRASYKCLDDLLQEGLHLSIVQDLDKADQLIQMIKERDGIYDNSNKISLKDLTQINEPWQSNPQCLRSLIKTKPNKNQHQNEQQHQQHLKDLNTQENQLLRQQTVRELKDQDHQLNQGNRQPDSIINKTANQSPEQSFISSMQKFKQTSSKIPNNTNDKGINDKEYANKTFQEVESPNRQNQNLQRNRSAENFTIANKQRQKKQNQIATKQTKEHQGYLKQKDRQQENKDQYIKKLKQTLNDYTEKHLKEQQKYNGDRNNLDSVVEGLIGIDMSVLCLPFDLKKIDEALLNKERIIQAQANQQLNKPHQGSSRCAKSPLSQNNVNNKGQNKDVSFSGQTSKANVNSTLFRKGKPQKQHANNQSIDQQSFSPKAGGINQQQTISNINSSFSVGPNLLKKDKKQKINKDLLFLRQINQEGGKVFVNHKDSYIIKDYQTCKDEDELEDIYDLKGNNRRIEIRKPRPRDIIKGKGKINNIKYGSMKSHLQSIIKQNAGTGVDGTDYREQQNDTEVIQNNKQMLEIISNEFEEENKFQDNDHDDGVILEELDSQNYEKINMNQNQQDFRIPEITSLQKDGSNKLFTSVLSGHKKQSAQYYTANNNSPVHYSNSALMIKSPANNNQNDILNSPNSKDNQLQYIYPPIVQPQIPSNQIFTRGAQSQQHSRRQSFQGKQLISKKQQQSLIQQNIKNYNSSQQSQRGPISSQQHTQSSNNRQRNSQNIKTSSQNTTFATNVSNNFLNFVERLGIPVDDKFYHESQSGKVSTSGYPKKPRIFSAQQRSTRVGSQDHSFQRTPSQSDQISMSNFSFQKMDYKSGAIAYRIAMKQLENNSNMHIKTSAELLNNINSLSYQMISPVVQQ